MTAKEFEEKWLNHFKDADWTEKVINDILEDVHDIENEKEENAISKIETFVAEWIELWPSPKQMIDYGEPSKTALIDRKSILSKMKGFLKEFKKYTNVSCTFEEKCKFIILATSDYLNQFRTGKQEWKYLKQAAYFITKDGNSTLAAMIIAGTSKVTKNAPTESRTNQNLKFS